MTTIRKKCLPVFFQAVLDGKKKFELRLNDFDIQEGDVLVLNEWDGEKREYTGRSIQKNVTFVGKFRIDTLFWPEEEIKEKGLQIISLE